MNTPTSNRFRVLETITGEFLLIQSIDGTIRSGWATTMRGSTSRMREDRALLPELSAKLEAFFKGEPVDFSDVPLPPGPPFMKRCWAACRSIPRGETRSYAELATLAQASPSAARAAGQAMRRNPQPIITPCHRVIGSTGRLHGFSGEVSSGAEAVKLKRWLLELEGSLVLG